MRILFVHASTSMSIGDVGRGYRRALERQGHDIADYWMEQRLKYHTKSIPPALAHGQPGLLARMASECILNEAMYHNADYVVIVSGLNVHPIALWLLGQVEIPAAVILTESPYDDEPQAEWINLDKVDAAVDLSVFTNDRYSALKYGWGFLAPSYDPAIHHPMVDPDIEQDCDVLLIGTGWPERQQFLEAVNWSGIKLRLYGIWPGLHENPNSPIYEYFQPLVVANENAAQMYCRARINLNVHRKSDTAMTPGPRVFEVAACGAFQLSDPRSDVAQLFGDSIPTFSTPQELESLVRYYLAHPEERKAKAAKALDSVVDEDFDHRAEALISALEHRRQTVASA